MMKIAVDTHTHTIASAHAYSTIAELAKVASKRGVELLAITDHGPALPDSCSEMHFMNYHVLPKELYGVSMLYGVELNIMDYEGNIDLNEEILKRQDICIASFHTICTEAGSVEENTNAYLRAMENPYVDIIGHPEDGNIPIDFEALVKKAKNENVMLEVNNSSQATAHFRLNTKENVIKMLKLCKAHEVVVSLGTDAHFAQAIGDFSAALPVLAEVDFPKELIANLSPDRFRSLLAKRRPHR